MDSFFFLNWLYRCLRIGSVLTKNIMLKGMPLLVNELLWSSGMGTMTQILSTKGLAVVGALNIEQTFTTLFGVCFFSFGSAVAFVTGQALGAGDG